MIQPTAPLEGPAAGPTVLGPYRLLKLLGTGGMGEVFLAERMGPGGYAQRVALKRLTRSKLLDEDARRGLFKEARIAARLTHPNVVQAFAFDEVDGEHLLAMEYVAGSSVRALVTQLSSRGQGLRPALAAFICAQALHGLHCAHELRDDAGALLGLVHRDISPENLLLSADGGVKVSDFGIARLSNAPDPLTGVIRGKPAYASPEHLRGQRVTRRSDIYSMGAVLQELLLLPHTRGEELSDELPLPAGLPRALEQVVSRALALRPEERFESAQEMAAALERCIESTPSLAAELAGLAQTLHAEPVSIPASQPERAAAERPSKRAVAPALALLFAAGALVFVSHRVRSASDAASGGAESKTPLRSRELQPAPRALDAAPQTQRTAPAVVPARPAQHLRPPVPARLDVRAYPWADVFLNGRLLGTTPMTPVELVPGDYQLILRSEGQTRRRRVHLRAGESAVLKVDFSRKDGDGRRLQSPGSARRP